MNTATATGQPSESQRPTPQPSDLACNASGSEFARGGSPPRSDVGRPPLHDSSQDGPRLTSFADRSVRAKEKDGGEEGVPCRNQVVLELRKAVSVNERDRRRLRCRHLHRYQLRLGTSIGTSPVLTPLANKNLSTLLESTCLKTMARRLRGS